MPIQCIRPICVPDADVVSSIYTGFGGLMACFAVIILNRYHATIMNGNYLVTIRHAKVERIVPIAFM